MSILSKKPKQMLLVGVWANRNWILGNWIKEVKVRSPNNFKLWWLPTVYSGKRKFEQIIKFPLPRYDAYFFSYPAIFKYYLEKNPNRFDNNSIVLYTHNETELGTIIDQVELLNKSFKTYFYCRADADNLISNGLMPQKVLVANCAIDVDCVNSKVVVENRQTIILASKFGPRKGAELLPNLISMLPEWHFVIMGKGWKSFLKAEKIFDLPNLTYVKFNKKNRSKFFSGAKIFLSLSNLEGGPVPLIESMSLGVIPISTNTGFAPEFIKDGVNGYLVPINPDPNLIVERINSINELSEKPEYAVSHLTWDRIARFTFQDLVNITS
jgi:glycosyltransferase involved in cell wall biosynthesis